MTDKKVPTADSPVPIEKRECDMPSCGHAGPVSQVEVVRCEGEHITETLGIWNFCTVACDKIKEKGYRLIEIPYLLHK